MSRSLNDKFSPKNRQNIYRYMKQNFPEFLPILFAFKCRSFELLQPKVDEIVQQYILKQYLHPTTRTNRTLSRSPNLITTVQYSNHSSKSKVSRCVVKNIKTNDNKTHQAKSGPKRALCGANQNSDQRVVYVSTIERLRTLLQFSFLIDSRYRLTQARYTHYTCNHESIGVMRVDSLYCMVRCKVLPTVPLFSNEVQCMIIQL